MTVQHDLKNAAIYVLEHALPASRELFIQRLRQPISLGARYLYQPAILPSPLEGCTTENCPYCQGHPPVFCLIGLCIPDDLLSTVRYRGVLNPSERHQIFVPFTRVDSISTAFDNAIQDLGEDETRQVMLDTIQEWETAHV